MLEVLRILPMRNLCEHRGSGEFFPPPALVDDNGGERRYETSPLIAAHKQSRYVPMPLRLRVQHLVLVMSSRPVG